MLLWATFDQNGVIVRVKILDSAATDGSGKTGLTSASAGLIAAVIGDSEATTTAYTQAGGTIEGITTLGTYAAPTATKCRFKELDATNHPGVYELQFADARFSVAGSKSLLLSIHGAAGAAQCDAVIPLPTVDLFNASSAGLANLSGDAYARLGAPAGASIAADLAAIENQTDGIGAAGAGLTALASAADLATVAGYVDTEITDIRNRLPAALVGGRMDASVGAMANNVLTAAATNADFLLEVNAEADVALADVGLTAVITGRIDAAISTRLATAGYTVPPTAIENADGYLDRDMSVGADTNARSPRNALRALRNKVDRNVGTGTITVMKEDDATTAWTAASTADAAANPIVSIDPA